MASPLATPGIPAGYQAETQALCRQGAETACLLAILLVPLFALLDYVVCTFATQRITDLRPFVSNHFFLITTGTITVVSTVVREHLRRREFDHRMALVDALHHKSDFMARMSHELRTPIHVMIGYADILLEEALDAGGRHARELVQHIRSHGALLHRLISDLLDYAKAEAGKMEVAAQPLRLAEVVEEVAESFRPLMDRKGLTLVVECHPGLPTLTTDREKVEQILRNLIANAVKFTEHGGVRIEARVGGVECLAGFTFIDDAAHRWRASDARRVLVFVRDSGIGIRQADVATLAADFQQVDPEAAARYGGTGLGLSISKKLVQLLGGRIAVRR